MGTLEIIGLIVIGLILLIAFLVKELDDAPLWSEEHGFYTKEEEEEMMKDDFWVYDAKNDKFEYKSKKDLFK